MKQPVRIITLLINFLLLSFLIYAQTDTGSKWSAGLVYSPGYSYRTLAYPESAKSSKDFFDKNDFSKFGYSAGISLIYRLKPAFKLESGILFSDKGYRYRSPEWKFPEENDPAVPLESTTAYYYRYLDVPLKLNWFFFQEKVRLFFTAGMSFNFFLDEFTVHEAIFSDRTETRRFHDEMLDFNTVALSLSGGVGMEYPLSKSIWIRLNPEFRHAIIPVSNASGKLYLWALGINTGMYFKLKKGGNSSHP